MIKRPWSNARPISKPIVFAAFDTESDGLGGALLAGTTTNPYGESQYYTGSPEYICSMMFHDMWNHPNTRTANVIWYGHFAQYDWRYLIRYLLTQPDWHMDIALRTDTDIYQITVSRIGQHGKTEKIIMRDSYAIFNTTLERFTAQFAPDHAKLHLDWNTTRFDPKNSEHIAYAIRDTESLRIALINFDAAVQADYGVPIKATFASTALAAWQQTLTDDEIYFPSDGFVEEFARRAYFGGLVFITSNEVHTDCVTYDINSSYPDVMRRCGVPVGRWGQTTVLQFDAPAFYDVTVDAPAATIIPILPRRVKGSIRWNTGTFRTVITNDELAFAMQHGYKLLQIHDGLQFEELGYPFTAFVDKAERIRAECKKTPRETVAKYMQNSLYGKFGSKRERNQMYVLAENELPQTGLDWQPWGDTGRLWVAVEEQEDMACRVEWAAWITAQARLHLLKTAYEVGPNICLYGDTDSLTLAHESDRLPQSDAYGAWKIEKRWHSFRAIAPKVYAGCTATPAGPTLQGAAKGLTAKATGAPEWRELLAGRRVEVEYESLSSLLCDLKKPSIIKSELKTRKSSTLENAKSYEQRSGTPQAGGQVRPRRAG